MDIVKIPKINEDWDNQPAWMPRVDKNDKPIHPRIMCKCSKILNIENYHIHLNGEVRASFIHNRGTRACGWHVFLNLEDYDGPELLPKNGEAYPL